MAQVTTSTITGKISTPEGQPLGGATVTATHTPSGTVYKAISNDKGLFTLPGLRIGGPYTVTVQYVGYASQTINDINLRLGEPYDVSITLAEASSDMQTVTVSATAKKALVEKLGPTTVIGTRELSTMPTISRSITDFTRLTPQASGNNFGGRDGRYNNLKVDGVNLNNNFGLSNDPLPGGGRSPISLDAFEQISVATTPFDVRQAGFTGAAINAATKSGTNEFHGTAYAFTTNQNFNGKKVGSYDLGDLAKNSNKIYGGSIGGPIIKNKLFFFVNGEYEKSSKPGPAYYPTGGNGTGTESQTTVADMQKVYDYVTTNFGYDPGSYQSTPPFAGHDWKILAKIDWNIDVNNKLTLKYTNFNNQNDWNLLNGGSIPNGGGFTVTGRTGTVGSLPNSRYSNNSMAFFNSNYGFKHLVKTYSAELNSRFSSKVSNQFLFTITRNRDTRITPNGQFFPTVDIFNGNGQNYISLGTDPFTQNNDVINNITSVLDNLTIYAGKHTITAGISYEHQYLGNMFMPGAASYYAYNSLDDFLNDAAPAYYAWTYSLLPGTPNPYSANLKTGQWGLYVQDEINVSNNFKLTAGIRADKVNYLGNPIGNSSIDTLFLPNANGDFVHYSTSKWPSSPVVFSPRVSFRWDVLHDHSLVVRGGTGLFTGRFPLVWLTNMPSNAGVVQFGGRITDPNVLKNIKFNPDPTAYSNLFTPTPNQALSGTPVIPTGYFALIDKNFRFPMVWTSDLAVDKKFGNGFTATVEATFTKDLYALFVRNSNLKPADSVYYEGDYTRPRYTSSYNKYYNGGFSAYTLENSSKGYSATFTAQISKSFSNGFYGSLAYVRTIAKSITGLASAQANSLWTYNPTAGTGNSIEMGNSQYMTPHRVTANASYRMEYAKHLASTFSLYYSGGAQGNISYTVYNDINNDGKSYDLMYIPKSQEEMNFASYTTGGVTFTPAQQKEAFEEFINNSPYLRSHRGQIAGRNAAFLPWYNQVDFTFLQDFFIKAGKTRHDLQFSLTILNFANLLNSKWGVYKSTVTTSPLTFKYFDATGHPVYTLYTQSVSTDGGKTYTPRLITQPYQDNRSISSTWQMQLGLRYSF
nr:TonB-dependent receptor [Arachidicoccus sp. BS20]